MDWVSLLIKEISWVKVVISSSSFMFPEQKLLSDTKSREKVVTGLAKTTSMDPDPAFNIWEADQQSDPVNSQPNLCSIVWPMEDLKTDIQC